MLHARHDRKIGEFSLSGLLDLIVISRNQDGERGREAVRCVDETQLSKAEKMLLNGTLEFDAKSY